MCAFPAAKEPLKIDVPHTGAQVRSLNRRILTSWDRDVSDGDTIKPKVLPLTASVLSLTISVGEWLAFSHGPDTVIGELEMSSGHFDFGHVAGNT